MGKPGATLPADTIDYAGKICKNERRKRMDYPCPDPGFYRIYSRNFCIMASCVVASFFFSLSMLSMISPMGFART